MLRALREFAMTLLPARADLSLHKLQGEMASMDAAALQRTRQDIARQLRDLGALSRDLNARLSDALAAVPVPDVPRHADWSGRVGPWTGAIQPRGAVNVVSNTPICPDMMLFHDSTLPEIIYRQDPLLDGRDAAPFALALEVMGFDGSFLSLAISLPEAAVAGLSKSHILQLDLKADMERPVPVFARLNIQHGPNHEDQVREIPFDPRGTYIEFDLAYMELNEKRVESVWVDLIFDQPAHNRFVIRDLYLHRRPRAEI